MSNTFTINSVSAQSNAPSFFEHFGMGIKRVGAFLTSGMSKIFNTLGITSLSDSLKQYSQSLQADILAFDNRVKQNQSIGQSTGLASSINETLDKFHVTGFVPKIPTGGSVVDKGLNVASQILGIGIGDKNDTNIPILPKSLNQSIDDAVDGVVNKFSNFLKLK